MEKPYFAHGLYKHRNNQGAGFHSWVYMVTPIVDWDIVIYLDLYSLPGEDPSCPLPASYL